MDPIRNPFAPGAGSQPPELAGRDDIISEAEIALQRVLIGRHSKSQILLGLRGTGKTVLLNKIAQLGESHSHVISFIEAPEKQSLANLLYPKLHQVLRKISMIENAKAQVYAAMRALRSFAGSFNISVGEYSLSVDPEPGVSDSGILELDMAELFIRIGDAAKSAGKAWTILIDEMQYLSENDLSALIVSIHRVNQKQLPVIFFGAGLPQIAGLAGDAKSYAERLFDYPPVGPLNQTAAVAAIRQPIIDEGEIISDRALEDIVSRTEGFPYFLQEWGYQAWNVASHSPIEKKDIETASTMALKRLDAGFFRVRFDRLSPKEREYVLAMANVASQGPYKSAAIAEKLGESMQKLGPRRAKIIHKGMIYSQAHGDIDFTVPMFAEFLRRTIK